MELLKRTWADVSLDALEFNYRKIRSHVPGNSRFLGVVKADAYGHGAVEVSRALVEFGAEYLAVSNLEEAVQLRNGGIDAPILILGYTPAGFAPEMVRLQITQEIHSLEYALQLNEALQGLNLVLRVHLKLDTGMSRIGFSSWEHAALEELLQVTGLPHLQVEGMFTHFSVSDSRAESDVAYTREQFRLFRQGMEFLQAYGKKPEICHCCNSGATLQYPEYALDMIRPGILTYGVYPSSETRDILPLQPLMQVYTTISQVRTMPAGTAIGYGRTCTTDSSRRVAVLAMGYGDGLSRRLSGRTDFLVHGKAAPVVGRICMDMCMIDVTEIPEADVGDEVTIIGGELTCDKMAEQLDTIPYEILCDFSKRVPRIYRRNGKTTQILQYIV